MCTIPARRHFELAVDLTGRWTLIILVLFAVPFGVLGAFLGSARDRCRGRNRDAVAAG